MSLDPDTGQQVRGVFITKTQHATHERVEWLFLLEDDKMSQQFITTTITERNLVDATMAGHAKVEDDMDIEDNQAGIQQETNVHQDPSMNETAQNPVDSIKADLDEYS